MRSLVLVLALATFCITLSASQSIDVNVLLGGGGDDPAFPVTVDVVEFLMKEGCAKHGPVVPNPWYRMGYRGFKLDEYTVYDNLKCESMLLELAKPFLPRAIFSHVNEEIHRLQTTYDGEFHVPTTSNDTDDECTAPVVGPDDSTKYDVQRDCCGFFVSHQYDNNCYDYGCDIATNTFAKPGRGTGQIFTENTCDNVLAAAKRDGLVYAGKDLPKGYPQVGHYVALLIWPRSNFHWIRKDTDTDEHWSHKPGGTEVRNVDDDGKLIIDPSTSNFSPWTEFCGYMIVVPSNVTIT